MNIFKQKFISDSKFEMLHFENVITKCFNFGDFFYVFLFFDQKYLMNTCQIHKHFSVDESAFFTEKSLLKNLSPSCETS